MVEVGKLNEDDVREEVLIGLEFGTSRLPPVCIDVSYSNSIYVPTQFST